MAPPSLAAAITYTEQATGSGCLGGTTHADCLANHAFIGSVLLTMSNNTGHVTGASPLFENFGTITVSVNGGPPVMFTDPQMEVFSAQSPPPATVGFADVTLGFDILDTANNAAFATYDLKSSIGPTPGTAIFSAAVFFPITGGFFNLSNVAGLTSTFTATTVAVPAPGGLPMLIAFGGAFFGARLLQWSKKRRIA
jgi:hypothetical protein